MTDASAFLASARSILLIDWPSRDVPDTLALAGLSVVAQEGPDQYVAYEVTGDEVLPRRLEEPPESVNVVYVYRPLDELPEIVGLANSLGATTIWMETEAPRLQIDEARHTVEAAGLTFIAEPHIVEALPAR